MSLAVKTFHGVLWRAASSWSQIGLNLLGVAIIARWVGPQSYGVMGAALLLTGIVRMLSEGAVLECLVQREQLEPGHIDASFWTATGLALIGASMVALFAAPLLALAGATQGGDVLLACSLMLPLSAAGAVPAVLLERDLKFREQASLGTLSAALSNAVGIAAALSGWGVWSLVSMELARVLVRHVLAWPVVSWRPGLRCRRYHFAQLLSFNVLVSATYLLGHVDALLPRALIGHLLGSTALGYYLLASRVFDELARLVTGPLAGVTMAIIARLQKDRAAVQRMILGLYQAASLLALPAFAGFIAIAPLVVPLAFGQEWLPAIPALQVLMVSALRTSTAVFNISILRAMGRADLPLWLLSAGVALNAVLIPALAGYGLIGAMLAVVLRQFAAWPLSCLFIRDSCGLTVRAQFKATLPAAAAAILMAVAVALLIDATHNALATPLTLLSAVLLGSFLYGLAIASFAPGLLTKAARIAAAALRRDNKLLASRLGDPVGA